MKQYEVDGWIGRRGDCKNWHNHVKSLSDVQIFKVHFCRWVEVPGKDKVLLEEFKNNNEEADEDDSDEKET